MMKSKSFTAGLSFRTALRLSLLGLALCSTARAYTVGERHLVAHEESARLRDWEHRDLLRITVWYPAAGRSKEIPLTVGPAAHPFFLSGAAALDAPFADKERHSVILFSHGFGGTARIMAWFGTALARAGYIVVAVDHPGNNGLDPMSVAGAELFWERPGDLATALEKVEADPEISRHLDVLRIGVAGFSAGGFTALAAAGGSVDVPRFLAFCEARPDDGVCKPQREFPITHRQAAAFMSNPEIAALIRQSHDRLGIPGVRAAFVMAPALVQSFDPSSLKHIGIPVEIVLGNSDEVAPPATNGEVAAHLIPRAKIEVLPGVSHYDFLAECTSAGDAALSFCPTRVPRAATHHTVINMAVNFFNKNLGAY